MTELEERVLDAARAIQAIVGDEMTLQMIEKYMTYCYGVPASETDVAFQSLCAQGEIKIDQRMVIRPWSDEP